MKAIRVALLSQWFDPEPTLKGKKFVKELRNRGFDVEVITGFPNYPGGKLYPGYRVRPFQREIVDGINITRLPLYPSHDRSAILRIVNYTSFFASSLIYGLFFMRRPDVLYSYHPPLTVAVTASILRMLRRFPVICDIQDIWPDTLRASGMLNNTWILGFISFLCQCVYRVVDRLVVLSPGFKRILVKRGVPDHKIDVIYNWSDAERKNMPISPKTFAGDGSFRIAFAGNMGKAQALSAVIQAAEILAAARPDICFDLIGSGVEEEALKQKVLEKKLKNVNFIPRVPFNEVGAILEEADALLVHLKDDPLFAITIPSKTQAYMALGKPLLMAVRGDAAQLVEQAGCGVLAIPENPQSLAKAAIRLADLPEPERNAMSENSWKYYERELSFSAGSGRFVDLFQSLIKDRA